jgi:hypothetical protein
MKPRSTLFAPIAAALVALGPSRADAYDEEVHSFLVRTALEATRLDAAATTIDPSSAGRVRQAIDAWARTAGDEKLRAEWIRRYPNPAAFDGWAEKELLLFSPTFEVFGIDRFPSGLTTLLSAVEVGSREPDDDKRNRDRLAYDANRMKLADAKGADVPADPALLNMGRLGVLSSQAHAHYGLADLSLSDDPAVLKTDPRRFAVAAGYPHGPVLTLAAEMAQSHLDLALIAGLEEQPDPTLAWLYTGQAFHYLEDVSNQIHTVQVGIYDFFVDATIERLKMAAKTGGGYLGRLRSVASIGIDILTNHHVISEQLTKRRVLEALGGHGSEEGARLLAAPKSDDADLVHAFDAELAPFDSEPWAAPFGQLFTRAMIEASSREGAEVYRATRTIADPRYRRAGVLYDEEHDDPDRAVLPEGERDEKAYAELFALQERAFRRAGTAMRRWVELEQHAFAKAPSPTDRERLRSAVIERLVRRQLKLLAEAESRRADYLAHPPPVASGEEHMPIMLAIEIIAVLAAAGFALRARRRRRTSAP